MLGLFGCYFMLGVLACGCLRLCFCIYIAWLWVGWWWWLLLFVLSVLIVFVIAGVFAVVSVVFVCAVLLRGVLWLGVG